MDRTFGKEGALRVKPVAGEKETEVRIDPLGRSIQFAITRKGDNAWLKVDATNLRGEKLPNYGTSVEAAGVPLDPWPGALLAIDFLKDGSPLVLVGGLCAAASCPHNYDEPGVSKRYLLKLKANGTVDPSFGKGGAVEFAPADTESTDDTRAYRVSATQDGNIVVAIDRPSGLQIRSLDTRGKTLAEGSFKFPNTHKRATPGPLLGLTKDTALLVHFDPDPVGDPFPSTAQLYRVNLTTGKQTPSMDPAIAIGGPKKTMARKIKVVGDSIYVLGHSNEKDHAGTISGYSVVRYNSDLSLARNFGSQGIASLKVGKQGWGGEAFDFSVMPDGKIYVVGTVSTSTKSDAVGLDFVSNYDLAVVRFNANGTPDKTFGENATQLVGAGSNDEAYRAIFPAKNAVYLLGKADNDVVFSMLR